MVRRLRCMPVGHPPYRHPPHHPVHDVELGVLRHRLVHRHRHVLPLPAAMAVDQRRDDAGGKLLAGDVVGVPDLRRDRRRVVFQIRIGIVAAVHHDPAKREVDQVGALEILPRPIVAERRHARRHQRRKARAQRGAIQSQCLVQRAAARIQQHVRAFQQAQHVLARQRLAQIEHHRLLVAVVVPEEQRAFQPRLVLQERPMRRVALPSGGSIFTTSAPRPASSSPVYSARSSAISITRSPASMPGPALPIISPGPRAISVASDMTRPFLPTSLLAASARHGRACPGHP